MKKVFRSEAMRLGLFICIGGIVGWLLLLIAYLLPTGPMEKNVLAASEELSQLGPNPMLLPNNTATRLDIYTDTIMLNEAVYTGNEGILEKTVAAYRYSYKDQTPFQSLLAYLSGKEGSERVEYARYWHGYLIFLKPLLFWGSYDDIKALNLLVQMFLSAVIVIEMAKRKMEHFIVCFLLGIYSLMPIATVMCFQYATVQNITLISCAVLLKYYERLVQKGLIPFFYVSVGMAVCYFDLLTYPLVTLGFACLVHITLEEKGQSVKKCVGNIVGRSIFWALGYVGIWGMKWILASIFMKKNIIKEGILQVLYRSSLDASEIGVTDEISRMKALLLNIKTIVTPSLLIAVGICLFIVLARYISRRKWVLNVSQMISRIVIAIMPFIWVVITANHSYIHYWMVYREFSITVFAVACIMASLICDEDS